MAWDSIIWIVIAGAVAIVALMLWLGRNDGIVRAEQVQPTMAERLERLDAFEPPPINNPRIEPPVVDVAVADRTAAREAPAVSVPPPLPAAAASDPTVVPPSRPART